MYCMLRCGYPASGLCSVALTAAFAIVRGLYHPGSDQRINAYAAALRVLSHFLNTVCACMYITGDRWTRGAGSRCHHSTGMLQMDGQISRLSFC
jgi:hypothetical protein